MEAYAYILLFGYVRFEFSKQLSSIYIKGGEYTLKIKGKFGTAILYATHVDDVTKEQVLELMNQRFVEKLNVRIMADCHAGAGCVIGTTMNIYVAYNQERKIAVGGALQGVFAGLG